MHRLASSQEEVRELAWVIRVAIVDSLRLARSTLVVEVVLGSLVAFACLAAEEVMVDEKLVVMGCQRENREVLRNLEEHQDKEGT